MQDDELAKCLARPDDEYQPFERHRVGNRRPHRFLADVLGQGEQRFEGQVRVGGQSQPLNEPGRNSRKIVDQARCPLAVPKTGARQRLGVGHQSTDRSRSTSNWVTWDR